ncbi:MAG: 2-oxoacid:acceptor oxidoreductase subunit alpha, partial [Tepidisphaeraceae bacterium]
MSVTTESASDTSTTPTTKLIGPDKPVRTLPDVAIRFAGDSGDGMQLAGMQFTDTSALFGNDISTLPD